MARIPLESLPLVDLDRFQTVAEMFDDGNGDAELEETFVNVRERKARMLNQLEAALAQGHRQLYCQAAHSLYGTSISLGLSRVGELTKEMECLDISINPSEGRTMLRLLHTLFDETLVELRRLIDLRK